MINESSFGSRRYRPRIRPRHGWPEVTALLDIMFLALLFFVLSSNAAKVSGISVDLPRTSAGRVMQLERFVISLVPNAEGNGYTIFFQDRLVDLRVLAEELLKMSRNRNSAVIIRADRRVSFEYVTEVMALAENAGVTCLLATVPDQRRDAKFEQ